MDFTFASDQMELRQKARAFAEKEIAPLAEELDAAMIITPAGWIGSRNPDSTRMLFPPLTGERRFVREPVHRAGGIFEDFNLCGRGLYHAGVGSNPIVLFGNEKQKTKYLPPLLDGSRMANFCLTERSSGSDVAGIQSTARLEGDSYVLNGREKVCLEAGTYRYFRGLRQNEPGGGGQGDLGVYRGPGAVQLRGKDRALDLRVQHR